MGSNTSNTPNTFFFTNEHMKRHSSHESYGVSAMKKLLVIFLGVRSVRSVRTRMALGLEPHNNEC